VFSDRYFPRALKTPMQVRNCLAYVLNNWKHHDESVASLRRPVGGRSVLVCIGVRWLERDGRPATLGGERLRRPDGLVAEIAARPGENAGSSACTSCQAATSRPSRQRWRGSTEPPQPPGSTNRALSSMDAQWGHAVRTGRECPCIRGPLALRQRGSGHRDEHTVPRLNFISSAPWTQRVVTGRARACP
jgi:hypothetical protein